MQNVGFTEQFCIEVTPIPSVMVIFGASGDLAKRKLFPALCRLFQRGLFHPKSRIVGFARTAMETEGFREELSKVLCAGCDHSAQSCQNCTAFLERISYVSGQYADNASYETLKKEVEGLETRFNIGGNRLFYLSIPSELYAPVTDCCGACGLTAEPPGGEIWRNVIIEKPFGVDETSALLLESALARTLKQTQIYRIDHYVGKETVQNIMMLRFANTLFEPVWNREYIDHVQISATETLGVGSRAGYYEHAGAVRDMFQNHLLQLMAVVGMESPVRFDSASLQAERYKVLQSVRPWTQDGAVSEWVRGQYAAGTLDGAAACAYRDEKGVAEDSLTETFAAAKVMIDNRRWQGVPFYLKSGKRLAKRQAKAVLVFKQIPHSIFDPIRAQDLNPDVLEIAIQPEEGITLSIQAKQPGPKMCMGTLKMSYRYSDVFSGPPPEAYERLILDAMLGDQTLFIQSDSILQSWRLLDPVLSAWRGSGSLERFPLHFYQSGSHGPDASAELLSRDQRQWL